MRNECQRAGSRLRQAGFVTSAEVLLLATMVGLFAVVTWGAVGAKLCAEFADLAAAFDSLDQSYSIRGFEIVH